MWLQSFCEMLNTKLKDMDAWNKCITFYYCIDLFLDKFFYSPVKKIFVFP